MSTVTTRLVDELARRVPGATGGEDGVLRIDSASAVETLRRVDAGAGEADHAGEPAGTTGDARPARSLVTGGRPDARAAIPHAEMFEADDGQTCDFIPAPEVGRIADALIAAVDELGFLRAVTIHYRWRRKAQTRAGKAVLGSCQKLSGQLRDEMGGGDFQIVLNAANCAQANLTAWQLEALIAHELSHIAPPDPDEEDGVPTLCGHDFEGFAGELRRYGLWHEAARHIAPAFAQARLAGL